MTPDALGDVDPSGCGGQFGCPCTQNTDCVTGWCIDGGEGYICTSTCIEDCPDGWSCRILAQGGEDIVSVCVPFVERPCSQCIVDLTCAGGTCITIEDEGRCAYGCESDEDCEGGFTCGPDPSGKKPGNYCVPTTGSCTCRPGVDGGSRPCETTGALGSCLAVVTCNPDVGWGSCQAGEATAEICDGLDNDCDGYADEDVVQGQPCQVEVAGVGSCAGTTVCLGAAGERCNGPTPTVEVCDGLDNDCDGTIDQPFRDATGAYSSNDHCGVCGFSCDEKIVNGTGKCVGPPDEPSPICQVDACDPGFVQLSPFGCGEPPDLSCLPCTSDADCLGGTCSSVSGDSVCAGPCTTDADCETDYACADLGAGKSGCLPAAGTCTCTGATEGVARLCIRENDDGTCYGAETCDPAVGWGGCTAELPAFETCDGLDNDCNGAVDDGLPIGAVCELTAEGIGSCPGQLVCLGGAGLVCTGVGPKAEACNYQDDDCDGAADEGFVNAAGKPAVATDCGACGNDCTNVFPNATGTCGGPEAAPICVVGDCDPGFIKTSAFSCELPAPVSCLPCDDEADCPGGACATLDGQQVCLSDCDPAGDGTDCLPGYGCNAEGRCVPPSGSCTCSITTTGAVRSCLVSNDVGVCFGVETCQGNAGWTGCTASVATTEVCNGQDDDCDFLIDEAVVPPVEPCSQTNEWGTCDGAWLCNVSWACNAPVPGDDVCDYKDNDCDGEIDESFRDDVGAYVAQTDCGACGISCDGAIPNAATTTCNAATGTPRCEALTCLPGLFLVNPLACVPPTVEAHCGFCQVDSDCPNPGDKCALIDGQQRCSRDCSAGNVYETPEGVCPAGWECLDKPGGLKQCEPQSGSCSCLLTDAGQSRICTRENAVGTCIGVETCDPSAGWLGCTAGEPAPEICDGGDDDCNYLIDDVEGRGTPCDITSDAGTCKGVLDCRPADTALTCVGQTPAFETCNQFDDDCDGKTDEGFVNPVNGAYDTATACGNCFTNCTQIFAKPKGYGVCSTQGAPSCKLTCCKVGSTEPGCDGTFDYYDLNGVPDDGCEFKLDTSAIYVSDADPAANDVAGCGRGPTQSGGGRFPCRTIARGILEATSATRSKVLVANGLYEENVVLVSGISLLGGFRPDNWQRSIATTSTTLRGVDSGSGNTKTLVAQGIDKATTVEGFLIYGATASAPGASSYAIWISNSTSALQVKSNIVSGGSAARGAPGSAGTDGGDGGDGKNGQDSVLTSVVGEAACLALNTTPGNQATPGDAGPGSCGGVDVSGGAGAGADCPNLNDTQASGTAGKTAASGGAAGPGGDGGRDRFSNNCSQFTSGGFSAAGLPGGDGGGGKDGAAGIGCPDADGAVVGAEWIGGDATGGGSASPGGGGGGGGAGGGADVTIDCTAAPGTDDSLGGSGGGGGAGGCAGTAGGQGGPGGGSFAVFITHPAPTSALPVVSGNTIVRGYGGDGGQGGPGGAGGNGGDGGNGGLATGNFVFAMGNGGRGGQGGDGGHGGGGGGGCGGVSYGIYVHNAAVTPAYDSANAFSGGGSGGAGGPGGASLGLSGTPGASGATANTKF